VRGLLSFLEQRALPYLVVARLTTQLKRQAAAIPDWQAVDEHYAVASSPPNSWAGPPSAALWWCGKGSGKAKRRWAAN
jgi:hypothetical protein